MSERQPRVAYIMSRFPKLTETFVLDEMLAMQRQGVRVEVFPLWRTSETLVHAEAAALVERAWFLPTVNLTLLRDNVYWLCTRPLIYLRTLLTLIRANRRSARFLAGALAVFPKAGSFARRMQSLDVDHVHAHFASHPAAAAYVVGQLARIPWSFTAHGSDLHREQAMLREKVDGARFVVAISEYNRRFILERVGTERADKVIKLHCGVDLSRFSQEDSTQSSDSLACPPGIVCIGTLHAVKGQAVLIRACARLHAEGQPFRCHLIGDGEDRQALEALASELGVAELIVFHGAQDRDQVLRILHSMTVVVAPSVPTANGRREGIPVALMEGAACGLPLVASQLSGIPELVLHEQTGLLTSIGDDEELAQALTRLLVSQDEARRFGSAARAHVEANFELENNVARLRGAMFEPATS